jgi:deazaflavin-dependent oxidoreductase (nitroreductase family)
MQMPRVMRRVNREFTNRLMAPVARLTPPLALIHHVGRKSKRAYRTPILAFPVADGVLTPLPYGTDTEWVLNLLAAGSGELEVSGRRQRVDNPRIVTAEEAMPLVRGVLRPAVRLLDLPGFLLLDRADEG